MQINILKSSGKTVALPEIRTKFKTEETDAVERFGRELAKWLNFLLIVDRPKILLCIGTDRSTGDSLGPLTGSKLLQSQQMFFRVYGTLDQPVHASNLHDILNEINCLYQDPLIIAIDACLGHAENVGTVNLVQGPLQPGAGVNKKLPQVGEVHITGIVNVGGFMEYVVLQNTRLNLVMKMADLIAQGICQGVKEFEKYNTRRL